MFPRIKANTSPCIILVTAVICWIIAGCAPVYQTRYLSLDETGVESVWEGYQIEVEFQTRAGGYESSQGMYHLSLIFGCSEQPGGELCDEAATELLFDSVSVHMPITNDLLWLEERQRALLLDDYYNRQNQRIRVSYMPVRVSGVDKFMQVSFRASLVDSETGKVLKSQRFTHKLKKIASRET